jgi:AbrB family looped-hinge helix DNA binding protein
MLKLRKNSFADSRMTMPKAFRDYWGLKAGDKINAELVPGGGVILRPAKPAAENPPARKPSKKKQRAPDRGGLR